MRPFIALLALLLVTACSSDAEEPAEPKEQALPTVSAPTTCDSLFDGDDAPMQKVVDLMTADTMPSDDDRARQYADDMEAIGAQAGDELEPHVSVVVDELREFADAVEGGETFQTEMMVTSLTELNNVCGFEPRF